MGDTCKDISSGSTTGSSEIDFKCKCMDKLNDIHYFSCFVKHTDTYSQAPGGGRRVVEPEGAASSWARRRLGRGVVEGVAGARRAFNSIDVSRREAPACRGAVVSVRRVNIKLHSNICQHLPTFSSTSHNISQHLMQHLPTSHKCCHNIGQHNPNILNISQHTFRNIWQHRPTYSLQFEDVQKCSEMFGNVERCCES